MSETRPGSAAVKALLGTLTGEERRRLVQALAELLVEEIRDRKRVENGRRLGA